MSDSGKQCQSGESDFNAEGLKPTGTGLWHVGKLIRAI